jgi:Cation transport ATPase
VEAILYSQASNIQQASKQNSSIVGLTEDEAFRRLQEQKKHDHFSRSHSNGLKLLFSQFKNPLILLLAFAALLSLILSEYSDSLIILTVLLTSGILGFFQERKANKAVQKLQALVHCTARVVRDGKEKDIPVDEVVKDDIVLLNAGDLIPADSYILNSKDLHVNESILTGESFPAEKFSPDSGASSLTNQNKVFKGTSVVNGLATIVCVNTGLSSDSSKVGC